LFRRKPGNYLGRKVSIFLNNSKIDIMKQASNQRRSRGRGNNNNSGGRRNTRNHTYESNGPEVKVRGSAQQVLDKYLQLARDSQSSGDRVKAEAYLQFAEHYYRIVSADQEEQQEKRAAGAERPQDRSGDRPSERAETSDKPDAQATRNHDRNDRPARGRGRGRNNNTNNANSTKNEATLAAEAAAANEAALETAKVEKPAKPKRAEKVAKKSSETVDVEAPKVDAEAATA
jgi:hypothetical protein